MRVLVISDLAHTGFGRVGRELSRGLLARGHDIRIIGINWRGIGGELDAALGQGGIAEMRTRAMGYLDEAAADPLIDLVMPAAAAGDGMGHNLTAMAFRGNLWKGWKPEGCIVVADPWAMWLRLTRDEGAIAEARRNGIPVLNYVPIEGSGLPLDWATIYEHVTPVAMAEFGQAQLEALLERPVDLAPHGVSEAFRPVSPADPGTFRGKSVASRETAKETIALGLGRPDIAGKTWVLRTDRYIFRKNYPAFFRIMGPLLEADPSLICVVHTTPVDDTGQGTIWQLISRMPGAQLVRTQMAGGTPAAVWEHPQVILTGAHDSFRGFSDDEMSVLYNAADLVVSPTMAEGFGLCLAESMAVGTPVVSTDYSAVSEVVGPGGILAPVAYPITNAYAHEWGLVDETSFRDSVRWLLAHAAKRREMGAAGRRHVARYTWTAAVDVFDRLLTA